MTELMHDLIGDWHTAIHAAIKAAALFLMAVAAFRLTTRRTIAQFAPFDWVAAVAVGAIVGRTATASDASWLTGTAALVSLLLVHAGVTRLRLIPGFQRFTDPPLRVLIHDGKVDEVSLVRCGMNHDDLAAVLRQNGYESPANVHIAILETSGAVSFVAPPGGPPG
jgi:uncharacterized membrane protein YcaP (DUF421 family)